MLQIVNRSWAGVTFRNPDPCLCPLGLLLISDRTAIRITCIDRVIHTSSTVEIIGLIFAFAGYLVSRVHKDVLFIFSDSLGA